MLSTEEMTETMSEESGSKEHPPAQIRILSRKEKYEQQTESHSQAETVVKREIPPQKVETTMKDKSQPRSDQPKKNIWSWINTVDPWSTKWIKNVCEHTDIKRVKAHLKTFVHESRRPEINNELVEQIWGLTMAETHIVLRELQHKPRYIRQSYNKNTLDITTSILTYDGKNLSTKLDIQW